MSTLRALALAACLLVPLGAGPARAEVQRIADDGAVYRVDVDNWNAAGKSNGTVLRVTRQNSKGGTDQSNVPGTDDVVIDRDPALEIDPSTGKPFVVWARNNATGFSLFFSRYGTSWSAAQFLVGLDGDNLEPQVRFDARYLHVSWRRDYAGVTTYWRSSFVAATLEPVFGPEQIPTDDLVTIPLEGGPSRGDAPSTGSQYFCISMWDRAPGGGSGRAYIWGVRDEPVPINYRESFLLPAEAHSASASDVAFMGGRLTYWFTAANKLYYTTLSNGQWAEMRTVELTGQMTAAEARQQVTARNQRLTDGHP